jgi:hypothetical protein
MWMWWLYRVIPSLVTAGIIGGAGYVKLWFDKKWPFWGRTAPRTRVTITSTSEERDHG